MNEFTKENRHISSEKLLKSFNDSLVILEIILQRLKKDNAASRANIKDLCLFFSNYSSGSKTIITRYLQKSGLKNQQINNMSVAELFVKFKKAISKDTEMPCSLTTELHLIVFDIRNKLSHNLNQVDYLTKVVEQSGIKKMINFLEKLSDEAKEIEHCYSLKIEKEKELEKDNFNNNRIEKEIYHFGIRY